MENISGSGIRATIREGAARHQEDLVDLLRDLIRFRSENPKLLDDAEESEAGRAQEEECQTYMRGQFSALGMEVDEWEVLPGRRDVVGTLKGEGDGRSLILNGHIDVVPAGDPSAWPHDPWSGDVIDGQLWGRGSCDMKGGVTAGIGALRILQEAGIKLKGDIVFQSVVDEETGGPGTRSTIDRGYRADAAIVLEPTSGQIVPVQGGLYWTNIIVRGFGGHAGARYRSVHAGGQGRPVNAIEKATKIIGAIQELERHWGNTKVHPLMPLGITTINPGMIAGGSGASPNGLPATFKAYANMADYCIIGLDLKYLPSEDGDTVKAEFEDYIARFSASDPWLAEHPPEIQWAANDLHFPPCDTPLDHPLVRATAEAFSAVVGPPEFRGYEAVTDLGFLAQAGIDGLIYGPGSIPRSHGTDEYIEISDLFSATEVLALAIADFCGHV